MRKILLADQMTVTLVDDEDYKWLQHDTWYAHPSKRHLYVARPNPGGSPSTILMHRAIMLKELVARGELYIVDHIDHDTLNNQRSNLRLATRSENNANARRFENGELKRRRGYSFKAGKYEASLKFEGKYYYLGRHATEREAAVAYNNKATALWGELATLNDLSLFDQEEALDESAKEKPLSNIPPVSSDASLSPETKGRGLSGRHFDIRATTD